MFDKKKQAKLCPLIKKPCIEHECMWYLNVRGTHPQTGQEVDGWDCSMIWQPVLMIENSAQQRSTGAAVESFRNEMVKANETSTQLLLETALTRQQISFEP